MSELETPRRTLCSSAERLCSVRLGQIWLGVGIIFVATSTLAQAQPNPVLPSYSTRKGLFNCTDDRGVKFTVDFDVAQRRVKIKRPAVEKEFLDGKVEQSTVLYTIPLIHRYQVSMEGSKILFRERLLRNDAILISERPAGYLDLDTGQFSVSGLGPVVRTDRPQYVITASCIDSKYAHVVASASEAAPPMLSPASFVSALRVALSREAGDVKPYGKDIEVLSELATRCPTLASSDRTCRVDRIGPGAPQGGFIPKPVVSGAEPRKLYAYAGPPTKAVGASGFRIAIFIDPRDPSRLDRKCTQGGPWNDILSLCMEPLLDAVIASAQETAVATREDEARKKATEVAPSVDASPAKQPQRKIQPQFASTSDEDATFDINLSCVMDATRTFVFVDTRKRFVRVETNAETARGSYHITATYLDGRFGPVISDLSGGNIFEAAMAKAMLDAKGNQFVMVDSGRISFGISAGNQTAQTTIDRQTGIQRGAGGVGTCTVLPNKGAIP